ncbi:unnamed protein product, partial [Closterium sp. NIES-53]
GLHPAHSLQYKHARQRSSLWGVGPWAGAAAPGVPSERNSDCWIMDARLPRRSVSRPPHASPRSPPQCLRMGRALRPASTPLPTVLCRAVPSDPAVDVTLGLYLRFNSALKAANPAIKTLLSISGDFVITNLFDNAASSPSSRSAFIQSAIALARKYNFDGLDLNLAYTTGNATLVSALLTDFRAAIESKAAVSGKSELLLSAIISAYEWTETLSYDVPTLNKTLDFVHVPTFDLHGSSKRKTGMHTALQDLSNPKRSIKGAMAAWVSRGLARSKAMLGLAMYGRTFTLDSTSSTVGAPAFGAGQSGSISQ